jgi:SAM-dependent methyltransferase
LNEKTLRNVVKLAYDRPMNTLKQLARKVAEAVGVGDRVRANRIANAGSVTLSDYELPPAAIRLGGHNFTDDRAFLDKAIRDAARMEETMDVRPGARILDIGCGVGRLPIGWRAHFGSLTNYTGVDVDLGSIRWCRKHIHGENVAFIRLDLANDRYNPNGATIEETFRLPLTGPFDAIHLYSVFSHMETADVVAYLREFRRLLAPDGTVFLTAFVEDDVEDIAINPAGYGTFPGEWEGALHCVRFDRAFFERLVNDAGLEILRFDHASDTDGQSAIFLRLAP